MTLISRSKELATLMSLPAMDGHIILLAGAGLLNLQIAPALAMSFISGPTAILVAATMEGSLRERILASLLAGGIATLAVLMAAILGTRLVNFLNFDLLKLFGAATVVLIGLILFGLRIPSRIPMFVMILGLITSLIWRN
ncbi:MAG: hypothetical protein CMH64_01865 [Nanoarchaeota archaeon]|nr:hypothetical protein [Nanoarchaeota archaeon]